MRFRVLAAAGMAGALVLSAGGCKEPRGKARTEEEAPRMASTLLVSDPRAPKQFLTGFYALENNEWRWTAAKFSLILRPPRGASQNGATLRVKLAVPDVVIQKVKATALSATVSGVALAPETYSAAGDYVYTRDVPARALKGESIKLDFALSKWIPPAPPELRDLGIIVRMIALEAK